MSNHVFVVSEWLAKKGHDEELWMRAKAIMALTKEKENGCLSARATRQITHPGSPSQSKYTIVLLQEYTDIPAFDLHCQTEYVKHFFSHYVENESTAIVEDWKCRLFSESE